MGMTRDKMEFAYLLGKYSAATLYHVERLLRYGATYKRLQEMHCNGDCPFCKESDVCLKEKRIAERIAELVQEFDGRAGFNGDPRGATVKIRVPDGYTNDWGQTGICVPTS